MLPHICHGSLNVGVLRSCRSQALPFEISRWHNTIGLSEGLPNDRTYRSRPGMDPTGAPRVKGRVNRYFETASQMLRLRGRNKEWREWHSLRYLTSRRTDEAMAIHVELYIVWAEKC